MLLIRPVLLLITSICRIFSYNLDCGILGFYPSVCRLSVLLSLVSIWTFFAFRCSFWFFVPTKSHNEQCDAQMETSTKNQNEQQKAITSNKRHLPVLVFEIELILSQKQERATKSSKRQRTANGNTHQKPKRATKSNKEHFSFPFSFIRTSSGPVEGGLCQEQ